MKSGDRKDVNECSSWGSWNSGISIWQQLTWLWACVYWLTSQYIYDSTVTTIYGLLVGKPDLQDLDRSSNYWNMKLGGWRRKRNTFRKSMSYYSWSSFFIGIRVSKGYVTVEMQYAITSSGCINKLLLLCLLIWILSFILLVLYITVCEVGQTIAMYVVILFIIFLVI